VIFRKVSEMPEAGFDLTSMIDVVMLLIVFFMMSSQFSQLENTPMDLPAQAGAMETSQRSTSVVIDLDATGQLRIQGSEVPFERLSAVLAVERKAAQEDSKDEAAGKERSQRAGLVIRADRNCSTRHLNRLALALAEMGARDWSLSTTGEEAATQP
jgi:biopolymer transport protein ExbD